jgi:hypothetical protein
MVEKSSNAKSPYCDDDISITSTLKTECMEAIKNMFALFADKDNQKWMSREAVEKWLICINDRSDRGSEMRAAKKLMEAREKSVGGGQQGLTEEDFIDVYRSVIVQEGKPWSAAYDLWLTSCETGCLPPKNRLCDLGEPFKARYDRIWVSTQTLCVTAVRAVRSEEQHRVDEPLPNSWSASDHLPLAATIEWA